MRFSRVALFGLLFVASSAWAQKVVVLELDGDPNNKLHNQIENALRKAGVVELISLEKYKENAAKKKLKGGAAMTAVGVTRTAKLMRIDAAVAGDVTPTSYKVVIYDSLGQELWTKSLPLKRGLLSEDFANKLARAIAAAGDQGASHGTTPTDTDSGSSGSGSTSTSTGDTGASTGTSSTVGEGLDLSDTGTTASTPPARTGPSDSAGHVDDPSRDTDLDNEAKKNEHRVGPPLIRAWLAGTTTWRAQCLRPGPRTMANCKAYDSITPKPLGIVIDFTASVPYLGLLANAELFPLANFDNRILQGFGVVGHFGYGASVTKIVEASDQGNSPEKRINSTDVGWAAQLVWRYHFAMGLGTPQAVGYAGVRGGVQGRSFNIDPEAGVSLPSSQRVLFGAIGLDVSVPIIRYFKVDASFTYFINPKVGPDQILGYGNAADDTGGVVSRGLSFEGGFSGEIWGPLGWLFRVRYFSFGDQYFGQGRKWTVCNDSQCGGIAEESYTSLVWGVSGSF